MAAARDGHQAGGQRARGEVVSRQGRQEDQHVLHPLVRPQRLEHGAHPSAARAHGLVRQSLARQPAPHAGGGRHDVGGAGAAPHRGVHRGVADVVEAALAEALHQPVGLGGARQVAPVGRALRAVEQREVVGHGPDVAVVGGGGEVRLPARRAGVAHQGEHVLVEGQGGDVHQRRIGHRRLEGRLAPAEREQRPHRRAGVGAQEREEGLHQEVRADQGAVEVDHQRRLGGGCARDRSPSVHVRPHTAAARHDRSDW